MEADGEDTESVLAAYRERKRKAVEANRGASPAPSPAPTSVSSAPAPAPAPTFAPAQPVPPAVHSWSPPASPMTPPASPPPAIPAVPIPIPGPTPTHPPAPAQPPRDIPVVSVPAVRSPAPLVAPGGLAPGSNLSPVGPALRLSETLLRDAKVSLSGSPVLRTIGAVLVLAGLALLAVDRRQAALATPVPLLLLAGLGILGVGCLLVLVGRLWPRNRRLAVRLAASQKEEWQRIQGETTRLVLLGRIGLGLAVAGLLAIVAGYALLSTAILAAGALATGIGLVLVLVAQVRRNLARRLYVQTLVLSGLEASGLGGGGADGRVQPVILALDQLLGALPEAEVQAFLNTPQARAYLELVDEATRSQRGP